jgi:hypothetical protein
MMLKMLAFAWLACASLALTTAPRQLPTLHRDDARTRELISEGLGVGRIYVGRSTAADVADVYGKNFASLEHGATVAEMLYAQLGLAFYYCPADEKKIIYRIEARAPFEGFTARGIILGKSTVNDVLKAYGRSEPKSAPTNDSWFYAYPGIEFHVGRRDSGDKPASPHSGSKITAIAVVADGGAVCPTTNAN